MLDTYKLSHVVLYNISYIVSIRLLISKLYIDIPSTNIYSLFIKNKYKMYFLFYNKMLIYYYNYFFYCLKKFEHSKLIFYKKRVKKNITKSSKQRTYKQKRIFYRKKKKFFWKKRKFQRRQKIFYFNFRKTYIKKMKIHKKYNLYFYNGVNMNTFDLRGYFSKNNNYEWISLYFGGLVSFFFKSKPLISQSRFFKRLRKAENVLKKSNINTHLFRLNVQENITLLLYLSKINDNHSIVCSANDTIQCFLPESKETIYTIYKHKLAKNSIFLNNIELPHSFFNLYNKRTRLHWN